MQHVSLTKYYLDWLSGQAEIILKSHAYIYIYIYIGEG